MEIHSGLRLLDRAADYTYCHNYSDNSHTRELQHVLRVVLDGKLPKNNTLEMQWMQFECVVPAFSPDPLKAVPALGRNRSGLKISTSL